MKELPVTNSPHLSLRFRNAECFQLRRRYKWKDRYEITYTGSSGCEELPPPNLVSPHYTVQTRACAL